MASNSNAMRQATPRGQMTRGANSGPAVMLMPPDVRSIFLPNPPLPPVPRVQHRRKHCITGVAQYLKCFETNIPPARILQPTPQSLAVQKKENKKKLYYETQLAPAVASYRQNQRETAGQLLFGTMNCYNTLFIGRLAYECTEMKLLRQMEQYGTVKDLRIIIKKSNKNNNESSSNSSVSRGYAFCEYEHEEDMKRAYRAADGLLIENRPIVVDVERGHTVPDWLPRRLGGGLGLTRPSKEQGKPVTRPGRYDPHKPEHVPPPSMASMSRGGPPPMMPRGGGYGGPPPPSGYGGGRDIAERERERGDSYYATNARGGPPPQQRPMMGGPPPPYGGGGPPYGGGGPPPSHRPPPPRGGNDQDYPPSRNKRYRSRSPDRYGGGSSGGRRRM
jgi:U1 small nuclear ribonucleoprotein 70kDa